MGVFLLLMAAFMLLEPDFNEAAGQYTPTPFSTLRAFNSQDLMRFSYQSDLNIEILTEREDALNWTVLSPNSLHITPGNIEAITTNLSNIRVIFTLQNPPPLDELGLKEPNVTILLTFIDYSSLLIEVGFQTPLNNGYYARIDGEKIVVIPLGNINQVTAILQEITGIDNVSEVN